MHASGCVCVCVLTNAAVVELDAVVGVAGDVGNNFKDVVYRLVNILTTKAAKTPVGLNSGKSTVVRVEVRVRGSLQMRRDSTTEEEGENPVVNGVRYSAQK